MDQANCYLKHLIGDRIPDQYRGLRQNIREHAIDLAITDILFLGNFALAAERRAAASCRLLWRDSPILARSCIFRLHRQIEKVLWRGHLDNNSGSRSKKRRVFKVLSSSTPNKIHCSGTIRLMSSELQREYYL